MSQYSEPGAKAGGAERNAATRRAAEPLAITSIACRLPGAPDVEAFWTLLTEERHAIGRLPEDRFSSAKFLCPGKPCRGRTYTNAAGVIDDLWDFDAGFFGLSPREAEQMDPQQRMMLEVAWRAIEAALPLGGPLGAARRPGGFGHTGVYIGASTMDHAQRFATDIASIDTPFMTGNTLSIIANRLSQTFGFEGPSLTVDTACASGVTALHLAAEALRSGEIETAVVGAVNVLLQPWNFVGFSQATMLSPTGLCRAFDAGADGYVRAEGAVALVLRRMEAAAAGGEPVRGVLRATGISADGLKPGLSKPDAAGQAALIKRVHRASGLEPERLAFIEAHGTGTPVGDPVEARAIAAALGPGRDAAGLGALPIGSVKSNIGHLEPAAGLAGVLKALLALERGRLPATLHVDHVNPAVAAEERLTVAREAVVLPDRADGAPHAAGVSAFGFGGANGHVVLEGVRATEPASRADVCEARPLPPLILSANTERGLRSLAAAWRETLSAPASDGQAGPSSASRPNGHVQAGGADLAKLLAASGQRSALRRERAVLLGDSTEGLRSALDALAAEDADSLDSVRSAVVARGSASSVPTRLPEGDAASLPTLPLPSADPIPGAPVGFLFGGNGAQWAGMGETLLAEDPVYAAGFARAAEALVAAGGCDPRVLREDPLLPERLQESGPAQAFLFALQVGMVDALAAVGVRPAAVLGHSVGEVTAAWAAGALTLADAARIIALRAAAVAPLHGTGTMAALLASAAEVEALIAEAGLAGKVALAAENSPRSVTLSGDVEGIEALSKAARRARLACRKLQVAYPYHAPAMELIRETLLDGLQDLVPGPTGSVALFSSVTGSLLAGPNEPERAALGAGHWWQNAREPVRFWSAAEAMAASGVGCLVEVSPRPVLAGYLRDLSAPGGGEPVPCLAAMQGPGRPSLPARELA
ncbi:MAG: type I polyketide synthase, partial [Pseudomonadota bacterium]